MARSVPAASPSVPRTGARSANQPTHRRAADTRAVSRLQAKKAALREFLVAAQVRSDRVNGTARETWALRYLEASRPTSLLATAPLSAEDKTKMVYAQADQLVGVIRAVLEGLKLSDADYTRGIDLAIKELRAASRDGWEPL